MFIIAEKKEHRILNMGARLGYQEVNGYPWLLDENIAFPTEMVDVSEVETVPEEVTAGLYCYTKEEGFYLNPNWEEPNKYGIPNEIVNQIQEDTITKLIEDGDL